MYRNPVGVSLLAISVCQAMKRQLIRRYREQAHSYILDLCAV
ncbi:hypothetical protein EMIT0P265_40507 [Pseudomonas zeae]